MNHQTHAKSSLFLIELMIAVLFFALGSAVCIQVFIKAYTINQNAQNLSFASLQASSAASVLKHTDASLSALREYFPLAEEDETGFTIYYDKKFCTCKKDNAFFTMHITEKQQNGIIYEKIQVLENRKKDPVYELALHYPSLERKGDFS